jgi:4-amino-4-deoxy-L-arabinose transferase-like glycosyltransferase
MALYTYAQKFWRKEYALLPGIIFLTAPVINSWGTMAYTDNILGFYLFLLCMVFLDDEKDQKGMGLTCGLLTGMALGIKYQAIPLVLLIYLFFLAYYWKKQRSVRRSVLLPLVIGTIIVSQWLVRNALATGNPFFPILKDIFPSDLIRTGAVWGLDTEAGASLQKGLGTFVQNPFSPFSYFLSGAWNCNDFQRFIGPLFLGLFPFVFLITKNKRKWPVIVLVFLLSLVSGLVLRGNLRYAVVLIALLSLLCGGVAQELLAVATSKTRALGVCFFAAVISLYSLQNYEVMLSVNRILTSLHPRHTRSFLRAFEPSFCAAEFANEHLPPGSKVLFHGLARYYYFNFDPLNDHLSQTWITYDEAKSGEDILRTMRERGISHIISQDIIPGTAQPNTILYDRDPRFVEFTGKYLQRLFTANSISIYQIR